MPKPPAAKIGTASQAGTAGSSTRPSAPMDRATTGKPSRTNRSGPIRGESRAWIQLPAVQESVAAVSATPAVVADQPRTSTRSSATYASMQKKAKVSTPRSRTAVG